MRKVANLALNENGFAFEPTTGESFTTNQSGLLILKALKESKEINEISRMLAKSFEMENDQEKCLRDVEDFVEKLKIYQII
jgi:hypothetical protein